MRPLEIMYRLSESKIPSASTWQQHGRLQRRPHCDRDGRPFGWYNLLDARTCTGTSHRYAKCMSSACLALAALRQQILPCCAPSPKDAPDNDSIIDSSYVKEQLAGAVLSKFDGSWGECSKYRGFGHYKGYFDCTFFSLSQRARPTLWHHRFQDARSLNRLLHGNGQKAVGKILECPDFASCVS